LDFLNFTQQSSNMKMTIFALAPLNPQLD